MINISKFKIRTFKILIINVLSSNIVFYVIFNKSSIKSPILSQINSSSLIHLIIFKLKRITVPIDPSIHVPLFYIGCLNFITKKILFVFKNIKKFFDKN